MVASGTSGLCKGSETRDLRVHPGHAELAAAALARHGARPAADRLTGATAGTHRVAIPEVSRQVDGVAWSGDDAPRAGWTVHHLQECGRHGERATAHFDDGLERPQLRDAIPRPAPQPDVQVALQAGPHSRHVFLPRAVRRAKDTVYDLPGGVPGHRGKCSPRDCGVSAARPTFLLRWCDTKNSLRQCHDMARTLRFVPGTNPEKFALP